MQKMKRAIVVGAGLSGATCAAELARAGYGVTILESRDHVAGNAYDHYDRHGVLIHKYGPHIFHTNSEKVHEFLSRFTLWNDYTHRVLAHNNGKYYKLPLNISSVGQYLGRDLSSAADLERTLRQEAIQIDDIVNAEDYLHSSIGPKLTAAFFSGYSRKQWGVDLALLHPSIVARVPVRLSFDDRYFQDIYQGLPVDGYTKMVSRMIDHPSIFLELNRKASLEDFHGFDLVIYTGPVDELLDYRYGKLPYRSLDFDFEHFPDSNMVQEVGTVNYPDPVDGSFTRITEFKHLTKQLVSGTTIVREIPSDHGEPYYPVPSNANRDLHQKYVAKLSDIAPRVHLAGRLAEYRYYNMDQAVGSSLALVKRLLDVRT